MRDPEAEPVPVVQHDGLTVTATPGTVIVETQHWGAPGNWRQWKLTADDTQQLRWALAATDPLLAAAPELMAACQTALAYLRGYGQSNPEYVLVAAIIAATGRREAAP